MLKTLFHVFLFLVLGEFIKHLLDIPIVGNIIGMALIFLALKLKVIKLETVKPAPDKKAKPLYLKKQRGFLVRMKGVEPPRLAALDPKSSVSTNSTTSAEFVRANISIPLNKQMYQL